MIHLLQICKGIGQNLYMALFPVFDPSACSLPDLPGKHIPTALAPRLAKGGRKIEGEARTFEWDVQLARKTRADGGSITLTEFDTGLLQQRGFKNMALAASLKRCWFEEMTASESARQCKCSIDYAKKMLGTFSTALSNENTVQRSAK